VTGGRQIHQAIISYSFYHLSTYIDFLRIASASPFAKQFDIMVQIVDVKGNNLTRDRRTATHTHIKGLGLREDGLAEKQSGGFVGQAAAREVYNQTNRSQMPC
jgi:hypothetical protein